MTSSTPTTSSPISILPLGAIIQSIHVGNTNIVLGFPTEEQYKRHNTPYFGETIGRVANRIRGAHIDNLDGKSWSLAANNPPNCLHGGTVGWGKHRWAGPEPVGPERPAIPGLDGFDAVGRAVAFSLRSAHGDEGFPGSVEARVIYTTGTQRVDGHDALVLAMEYEARLVDGAEETAINMTNHSYFNLSGAPTTAGTSVTLATRNHLAVDANSIPLGPAPIPFPSLDTTSPFVLGATEPSIDHCFTLATDPASVPVDTRAQPLVRNIAAFHPDTGIHLEVLSTEPAFQFYTGDFIDVPAVDGAPARGPRSGFCCEPGRFVNACNVP